MYAFWLVETVIIFCLITYQAAENETPFCENCDCWTEAKDLAVTLKRTDTELLQKSLEAERYEVLDHLKSEEVDESGSLLANVHCCPRCSDSNYLTISEVTITQDKEEDPDLTTTVLINQLHVPNEVVDQLASLMDESADEEAEQTEDDSFSNDTDKEDTTIE